RNNHDGVSVQHVLPPAPHTHLPYLPYLPYRLSLIYLLSLNPAGTATSAAVTSVTTFRTSVVVVMNVARGFFSSSPPVLFCAIFFANPPSRPLTPPDAWGLLSSSLAFASCAICS